MGYDGGICPQVMAQLFQELKETKQVATIVSAGLVQRQGIEVSVADYQRWQYMAESRWATRLTQAFMAEWKNCLGANKLPKGGKVLCDPVTILVALTDSALRHEMRAVPVEVTIKWEHPKETKMMATKSNSYLKMTNVLEVKQGPEIQANAD